MGAIYRVSRGPHAQSTTADSITINIPAGYRIRILGAMVTGMDNAAAAGAEMGIFDVTTAGSGGSPTSVPIQKVNPESQDVPTGMTAVFGYTTQPTIAAAPRVRMAYQPLGGKGLYNPQPGAEVEFGGRTTATQVSVRGITGTPQVSIDAVEFEVV